jgi:hypothetical protein
VFLRSATDVSNYLEFPERKFSTLSLQHAMKTSPAKKQQTNKNKRKFSMKMATNTLAIF